MIWKNCRGLYSNLGPLDLEAITVPTKAQGQQFFTWNYLLNYVKKERSQSKKLTYTERQSVAVPGSNPGLAQSSVHFLILPDNKNGSPAAQMTRHD